MDPLERAVAKALAEQASDDAAAVDNAKTEADQIGQHKPVDARATASKVSIPASTNASSATNLRKVKSPEPKTAVLRPPPTASLEPLVINDAGLSKSRVFDHNATGIGPNIFTMLRSQVLQKMRRHQCQSLAIVGPTPGVGKSSVATNLAISIARKNEQPVVLVDLDLRKPSILKFLGVKPKHDVIAYLEGKCDIEQVCSRTQYDHLHLCLADQPTTAAAELLANSRSKTLLGDISDLVNGAIIIVDLPPIVGVSDVHSFLPNCDAALVVVEYSKTSKQEISETLRLLENTPLIGSVVNKGHLTNDLTYGYGYGFN